MSHESAKVMVNDKIEKLHIADLRPCLSKTATTLQNYNQQKELKEDTTHTCAECGVEVCNMEELIVGCDEADPYKRCAIVFHLKCLRYIHVNQYKRICIAS